MKENKEIFVRLERCMGCRSCEMACAVEHSASKNLLRSITEKPVPVRLLYVEKAEGRNVPMICRHCEDAPCVAVCRTGALIQNSLSGVVERNEENCIGCWMCAMICPYGVVGRKTEVRMAIKCDRCKSLEIPACVAACPTGALIYSTQREFVEMLRKEAAARIAREARGLARA